MDIVFGGQTNDPEIVRENFNKIRKALIPVTPSTAAWGGITGTLSDQTDLQAALDDKENIITAGSTSQYWRGDKTWQDFNSTVLSATLAGISIAGGAVTSSDGVLTAFGKLQNQINGVLGGATYQGVWNASTNSPSLAAGTGTKGYYYVVSVNGSTNLDGITDWKVGDWAIFNGTTWDKVDNTDAVSSVNGAIGAISLAGTANRISVSGTTFDIASTYAGQSSINTVGTIATGVWNGTAIGSTYGGTGLTTYAKGDVLIATGTNVLGVVSAASTDGYVFTWDAASGLPMWKAASGGGGGGVTALSAIGSTPNANAATITSSVLNLQPASTSFGGVITTGTQSFAGAKTFNSPVTVNPGTNNTLPTLAGYEALILQRSTTSAYGVNLSLISGTGGPADIFFGNTSTQNLAKIGYLSSTLSFGIAGTTLATLATSSLTVSSTFFRVAPSGAQVLSVGSSGMTTTIPITVSVNSTGFSGQSITNSNATGVCSLDFFNDSGGNGYYRVYGSSYVSSNLRNNVSFGSKRSAYIISGASGLTSGDNVIIGSGVSGTPILTSVGYTGNILIGTSTDVSSSIFTVESFTKGWLPPRMTTTQKNAIASPTEGLEVYDITLHKKCVYTGTAWETITSA